MANVDISFGKSVNEIKLTSLHDFFPSLFIETKNEKNSENLEVELNKERMKDFAFWHNQKRKVVMNTNGRDDTGTITGNNQCTDRTTAAGVTEGSS